MLYSIDKDIIVFISCMFTHVAILDATFVEFRQVVKKKSCYSTKLSRLNIFHKKIKQIREIYLGVVFVFMFSDSIFRVWSIVLKCLVW